MNPVMIKSRLEYIKVISEKPLPKEITRGRLFNSFRTVEEDRVQRVKEAEERRIRKAKGRIAEIEKELTETKGLFSGLKKKKILEEIEELKRKL